MQDIRQKFISVKEKVEKSVFDTYLLKYIETPLIDEDKLLILISIMEWLKVPYNEMENFAHSTMLIQIALDTHEHISKYKVDDKTRELTVLTGDYYSGLYYKLLAESENIMLIRALSQGIKEVNENKISVYHKDSKEIETLMTSLKMIESSIIVRFTEYFKADIWKDVIIHLFFFKRLLKEKYQFIREESSLLFESLKKIVVPVSEYNFGELSHEQKQQLLNVCDHYLEISKGVIEKGLQHIPFVNEFLSKRVTNLLTQHQPYAKTIVEEG
ncbi:heptaprenyl diphosphate synthase component 1 [Neobacillus sp. LXY-1]